MADAVRSYVAAKAAERALSASTNAPGSAAEAKHLREELSALTDADEMAQQFEHDGQFYYVRTLPNKTTRVVTAEAVVAAAASVTEELVQQQRTARGATSSALDVIVSAVDASLEQQITTTRRSTSVTLAPPRRVAGQTAPLVRPADDAVIAVARKYVEANNAARREMAKRKGAIATARKQAESAEPAVRAYLEHMDPQRMAQKVEVSSTPPEGGDPQQQQFYLRVKKRRRCAPFRIKQAREGRMLETALLAALAADPASDEEALTLVRASGFAQRLHAAVERLLEQHRDATAQEDSTVALDRIARSS